MKSSESLMAAQKDLETVRATIDREVTGLRDETRKLNNEIAHYSRQLQIMRHYKDNEFPVRVAKIEQMKDKLTDEKARQEEKLAFLQTNIVEKTMEDIKLQSNRDEARTIEQVTKVSW